MRNTLLIMMALLFCGVAAGTAHAGSVPADIVFIIDDSVSMAGDIAQVKARIGDFNAAMLLNGIDAKYAFVRYGGPTGVLATYGHTDHASLEQDLTDFTTFSAAGSPFALLGAPTSTLEKGSLATSVGLSDTTFRVGAVKNFILITDEDDDSSVAEFDAANAALTASGALFNFIGRPGVNNTNARYGVLAANHGGVAFDILAFRANPGPFFDNFIATKVQEIRQSVVPVPGAAWMGLGLLGVMGAVRRYRNRRAA